MNDKFLNIIQWISQIFLPAIGTLYMTLAGIWGLPYAEYIVGTLAAVDTLLGSLIMINNKKIKEDSDKPIQFNSEMNNEFTNGKGIDLNE